MITEDKIIKEIKKNMGDKEMIVGTEKSIKELKKGKLKKVFITSNCPEDVEKSIRYYGKLGKAEVVKLSYANDELGTICKKPFAISVLGLKKE